LTANDGRGDRPTYREVGSADLVGNIDRPTYKKAGIARLLHSANAYDVRFGEPAVRVPALLSVSAEAPDIVVVPSPVGIRVPLDCVIPDAVRTRT
jgi:hypothetical protein